MSHTTRFAATKNGRREVDGLDYHFVSDDDFAELEANGDFVEVIETKGKMGIRHKYGTARTTLEQVVGVWGLLCRWQNLKGKIDESRCGRLAMKAR